MVYIVCTLQNAWGLGYCKFGDFHDAVIQDLVIDKCCPPGKCKSVSCNMQTSCKSGIMCRCVVHRIQVPDV